MNDNEKAIIAIILISAIPIVMMSLVEIVKLLVGG